MGIATAGEARYRDAVRRLFPQGDYWDAQFADAKSDTALFAESKLQELIHFRNRMSSLQSESVIEAADELIADWERVLLGDTFPNLDINRRRLQLKSKRDIKLNKAELQKTAAVFDLNIKDVIIPYRPAFFGHSYFNTSFTGSPVTFSVLLITAVWGKADFWHLIKAEYPAKRFTRPRFGIERLVYFPVRQLRLNVNRKLREGAFAFNKIGIERFFPSPSCKYKSIAGARLRASSMGFMPCGTGRLVYSPIPAMRGIVNGYFRDHGMGFARFGKARLAYSAAYAIRRFVRGCWRSVSTGLARFGTGRLLYIPLATLRGMAARRFRVFRFGAVRFGASRLAHYADGFQNNLLQRGATGLFFADFYRELLMRYDTISHLDAALVKTITGVSGVSRIFGAELIKALVSESGIMPRFDAWFMNTTINVTDFYLRLEQVLIDHFVTVKKMFLAFEQAIKDKLLANHIAYFNYDGE